ncbi:MAG TPA: 50S ribosomal protein L3 [Candidatus Saccharimonadales bacterium]|nr:50S ribosomal protein L3 [Candidatus Saccharimonadales bacterium]
MKALLTRKLGMTNILGDNGAAIAVTLLSAQPNTITQIKTAETDGYTAVQVGFENKKKIGKALAGHLKAAKVTPKIIREFRITNDDSIEQSVGDQIVADSFEVGDVVHVTGVSKGKGFAGTIKRHGFHRGRKTHGGRSYRRPGSIGSMYPQRIFPGKKMAGHMGHEQVTTKNLRIALVDNELGVIGIEGAVPGPKKGLVLLKGTK